jgi:hypothetical protein
VGRIVNALSDVPVTGNLRPPNSSYEDWGFNAMNINASHGNCVEMACVAVALVRERFPGSQMWGCSINPPGDHFFAAVGHQPTANSVQELEFEGCVIVDPWMNICCPAGDYPRLVTGKLEKWSDEGKLISSWVGAVDGKKVYWNPGDLNYRNGFLHSLLTYQDTRQVL